MLRKFRTWTCLLACIAGTAAVASPVCASSGAMVTGVTVERLPAQGATLRITEPTPGSVAPYVDSPRRDVERMLELAQVGPDDVLVDLGSGDGRIVIAAARRGALALGVEIEPALVSQARDNAREAGVGDRARFVEGDIFEVDVSDATVVTLYLFPDANIALRPRLLEQLEPGTRVLSNSFDMGAWQPDVHVEAATSGGIFLWHVPAQLAGRWQLRTVAPGAPEPATERRIDLQLEQRFQQLSGVFMDGDTTQSLRATRLRGNRVRFEADIDAQPYRFAGRVDGDHLSGMAFPATPGGGPVRSWTAWRLPVSAGD